MIFLVMLVFGRGGGTVTRVLLALGLIEDMSQMASILYGNMGGLGIIVTFVFKGAPFVALFTLNVMDNISKQYEGVAKTLGCSQKKAFG